MKKILLIALLLTMAISTSQAQTPWSAWLYDSTTGEAWQVNQDGTVLNALTLPTVMAHDVYSDQLTVSPNGERLAYSVYSSDMGTTQFLVYDVPTDVMIATYTPPDLLLGDAVSIAPVAFNRLGTAVTYGYLLQSGEWQIIVLDVEANTMIFQLSSSDPMVAGMLGDAPYLMPVPQYYGSAEVNFTMVPYGTEGPLTLDNYRWDLLTNSMTPTLIYTQLYADTLPRSGEVVITAFDERLPNMLDSLPFPYQTNTVQIYDPDTFGRFPVLANEGWSFSSARFIEGGARVIASAYVIPDDTTIYPIIQRSGAIDGYAPISLDYPMNIGGTSDGFVYLSNPASSGPGGYSSTLYHVNSSVAIDSGSLIWSIDRVVRLAWVGPREDMERTDLAAWTMLAPPLTAASSAPISPADAVPGEGEVGSLRIGGQAVINTTDGDRLNMRSGPGVDYQRIARVADGTTVTVLEGPTSADGFVWWRVRMSDGTEGWVVQQADDVRTLIPAG